MSSFKKQQSSTTTSVDQRRRPYPVQYEDKLNDALFELFSAKIDELEPEYRLSYAATLSGIKLVGLKRTSESDRKTNDVRPNLFRDGIDHGTKTYLTAKKVVDMSSALLNAFYDTRSQFFNLTPAERRDHDQHLAKYDYVRLNNTLTFAVMVMILSGEKIQKRFMTSIYMPFGSNNIRVGEWTANISGDMDDIHHNCIVDRSGKFGPTVSDIRIPNTTYARRVGFNMFKPVIRRKTNVVTLKMIREDERLLVEQEKADMTLKDAETLVELHEPEQEVSTEIVSGDLDDFIA